MSLFKTLTGVFQPGSKTQKKATSPSKPKVQAKPAKPQVHPVVDPNQIAQAQAKAREIILEARDQALKIKSQAEQESRKLQNEFSQKQAEIARLEAKTAKELAANETKQQMLSKLERDLSSSKIDLDKRQSEYKQKLQQVAQMTKDEARQTIFSALEKRLKSDIEQTIKSAQAQAKEEAKAKAREILIDAIKHGATDYVAEYTVSTVKLPNEESKGRIIGKEGRNIRAFEKVTGVDIDLDETPGEIRLSSFDPIRREIARVTLTKLLADGRIQPTRIEEYAKKAKNDLERTVFEEGKKLSQTLGVYNLPRELLSRLGHYKFIVVEGQNLLSRTMEQAKIAVNLAEEMNADVDTVRLGCLLHDIGRTVYDEEGSHVDLAVRLLKKFNLPKSVIECVNHHHDSDEFSSAEAVIVYVADMISINRPGASYEAFNEIVKRLNKMEEIAKSYEGVAEAYVLQAGREVRVIVHPEKVSDIGVGKLALDIKDRIREEMSVTGNVNVTVVRETRAAEVAK